jgi:hypothetical protein
MKVTRIAPTGTSCPNDVGDCEQPGDAVVLGNNLSVLPNNHGPQTDRLIYHINDATDPFKGYDSGDRRSREVGLYDQPFVDTFIQTLPNGARIIAGQFDDPYQLDEKGIFDLVNLNSDDLGGIPGARRPPAKDVFTGFNVFSIALEVPMSDVFPHGVPHNGQLLSNSTDTPAGMANRPTMICRRSRGWLANTACGDSGRLRYQHSGGRDLLATQHRPARLDARCPPRGDRPLPLRRGSEPEK